MSDTVTVACKLPNGLQIHVGETKLTLNGANQPGARFGFGLTTDVDADFFKTWVEHHATFPAVKNGSIFAFGSEADAVDAARERMNDSRVMTGQEPLNAEAPMPGIEPTDEMKKELAKTAGAKPKAGAKEK
jgi:hypothetical protein